MELYRNSRAIKSYETLSVQITAISLSDAISNLWSWIAATYTLCNYSYMIFNHRLSTPVFESHCRAIRHFLAWAWASPHAVRSLSRICCELPGNCHTLASLLDALAPLAPLALSTSWGTVDVKASWCPWPGFVMHRTKLLCLATEDRKLGCLNSAGVMPQRGSSLQSANAVLLTRISALIWCHIWC